MGILKTSAEVNKSFGTYRNKFYPGRKMVPTEAFMCNQNVWYCQLAIKTHDEGRKCPFCGGKPNPNDWEDKIEYAAYDHELQMSSMPYIVSEGSCSVCGQWWMVRDNPTQESGAIVQYDLPRTCHTFDGEQLKMRQAAKKSKK